MTAIAIAFAAIGHNTTALADAAVVPLVSVGATIGNCALLTVPAGSFNAGGYLAIDVSTPGGRAMYATAMLAFTLNKPIWVNRTSQPVGCYGLTDYATDLRAQQN